MRKETITTGVWSAALTCTMRGMTTVVLAFAALVTALAQKEQGDVYLLPRVDTSSDLPKRRGRLRKKY